MIMENLVDLSDFKNHLDVQFCHSMKYRFVSSLKENYSLEWNFGFILIYFFSILKELFRHFNSKFLNYNQIW